MLAENKDKPRTFLVIDGKQRLLSIAGFVNPSMNPTWEKSSLTGLTVLTQLNGVSYEALLETEYGTQLQNATIRCSIISNYQTDDVLYDIFYRLNTGSVPLSTQELRQVLIPGAFADNLIDWTNERGQPIHQILGLSEPDKRLRDVELVLRFIAFYSYSKQYQGDLKGFLDKSMSNISSQWDEAESRIKGIYSNFNKAIELLIEVLGTYKRVGRKYQNNKWSSFNKVLFEVEVYYFIQLLGYEYTPKEKEKFITGLENLSSNNSAFRRSIEVSTKDLSSYRIRYTLFKELVESSFDKEVQMLPLRESKD